MKINYKNPISQAVLAFVIVFIICLIALYASKPKWVKVYNTSTDIYQVSNWLVILYSMIIALTVSILVLVISSYIMYKRKKSKNSTYGS